MMCSVETLTLNTENILTGNSISTAIVQEKTFHLLKACPRFLPLRKALQIVQISARTENGRHKEGGIQTIILTVNNYLKSVITKGLV